MKNEILKDMIRVNGSLVIPSIMYKNFDEIKLDGLDLILMIYFMNQNNTISFDIVKIAEDLNIESSKVLEIINNLNEKNYISFEMKKNDNNVIEEYISIEPFYNKLLSLALDSNTKNENTDIFSKFEKEFGRTLNPTEIEKINSWIEGDISEELIIEALKEASLSNVHQIRYIDSILFRWVKSGYKTVKDIKRKKPVQEEKIEELYAYDWLNE